MRTALVTGVTGFVGRVFTRALLDEHPGLQVFALARGRDGAPARFRPELRALRDHPRFQVIEGDVTLPGLGLPGNGRTPVVPRELDACFHLAARTDFKEKWRRETFEANVEGTRNLVAFLRGLERPGTLFHVSTAYVAGVRPGELIREEILGRPPRFCNPYEESKHEAERIVAGSGLDWTILRPSIIVGDSRTGEAESDKMIYGALKVLWRFQGMLEERLGRAGVEALPPGAFAVLGRGEVSKNLICVDDVVRLALAAARAAPPPGTVLHLVNPRTVNVEELYTAMVDLLGIRSLRLVRTLPEVLSEEEQALRHGIEVYEPYLFSQEPVFDTSRARAVLGDAEVARTLPIDRERLRFLVGEHIRQKLSGTTPVRARPLVVHGA